MIVEIAREKMKSINQLSSLEGRVACVTGASGNIGNSICEAILEAKGSLIMIDNNSESLEFVSTDHEKKYDSKIVSFCSDLSDSQERKLLLQEINKTGRVDILVNCAAFVGDSDLQGWTSSFIEQDPDLWSKVLELNLVAPFHLSQGLNQKLSANGNGSVINISSIYGFMAPDMSLYEDTSMGNPAAYSASKGGLIQLTKWLAVNMAPSVRVNSISPGGIERNQPKAFIEKYQAKTPLGRMGSEEDLKGSIIFLASDLSKYVTGQNIIVDGGWSC